MVHWDSMGQANDNRGFWLIALASPENLEFYGKRPVLPGDGVDPLCINAGPVPEEWFVFRVDSEEAAFGLCVWLNQTIRRQYPVSGPEPENAEFEAIPGRAMLPHEVDAVLHNLDKLREEWERGEARFREREGNPNVWPGRAAEPWKYWGTGPGRYYAAARYWQDWLASRRVEREREGGSAAAAEGSSGAGSEAAATGAVSLHPVARTILEILSCQERLSKVEIGQRMERMCKRDRTHQSWYVFDPDSIGKYLAELVKHGFVEAPRRRPATIRPEGVAYLKSLPPRA